MGAPQIAVAVQEPDKPYRLVWIGRASGNVLQASSEDDVRRIAESHGVPFDDVLSEGGGGFA